MFWFKKILSPFFFPLPLVLGLLTLGVLLLFFSRRQRAGKVLALAGLVLLALLSFNPVPEYLLKTLEDQYLPLKEAQGLPKIAWVVVLAGGHTDDPRLPAVDRLSGATLARLVEGIRLQRQLPGSKLVLSGGNPFGKTPSARVMALAAASMGVEEKEIVLESVSRDTEEEAVLLAPIVRRDRFILVTSASHMPRSMALFRKQGLRPIPAPTDRLIKEGKEGINPSVFFPSSGNWYKAETVFYEYLGLTWAKIRGKI